MKIFRKKYNELGGDGIYAAWALNYEETVIKSGVYKKQAPYYYEGIEYPRGICPSAEVLQPKLMQFVTNYGSLEEAEPFVEALDKTIRYFS